jgi:hypothetical protein
VNFRSWCQNKWFEHVDEMIDYTGKVPVYLPAEYFRKYKWWLMREYRYHAKTKT